MALFDDLSQFYGTEHYHRCSLFARNILTSDGVFFLTQNGAGWLIDLIVSHYLTNKKLRDEQARQSLLFWNIVKAKDESVKVECIVDLGAKPLAKQKVDWSDLQLTPGLTLRIYAATDDRNIILYLPTEH